MCPPNMVVSRRLLLHMHPADNVATALAPIAADTVIPVSAMASKEVEPGREGAGEPLTDVTARGDVPFGHKIALRAIKVGEPVRKYGEAIGLATTDIAAGDHIHTHNVDSQRGRGDLKH
jgi:hypothetical protein